MNEFIDPECGCLVAEIEWQDKTGAYVYTGKTMIRYCPQHAAAPELFEALERLLDRVDHPDWDYEWSAGEANDVISFAQDVLTKAKKQMSLHN